MKKFISDELDDEKRPVFANWEVWDILWLNWEIIYEHPLISPIPWVAEKVAEIAFNAVMHDWPDYFKPKN